MKKWIIGKVIAAAGALFLLAGVFGCGGFSQYRPAEGKDPEAKKSFVASYRFEDIPIPPEMALNRKDSFVYETGKMKAGLLVYEGRGEIGQFTAFFKQKMGEFQWRLVSNFELNNVMLVFLKEGWTSVIYILPQEGDLKRVEVRVGPVEMKIVPST